MKNRGEMRALILAGAPSGISGADFETKRSTFQKNARKLEAEGLIFPGGHHKTLRYFDTRAKALEWHTGKGAPLPRNLPRGKASKGLRAVQLANSRNLVKPAPKYKPGWEPWAPMHITAETKKTKCPPCRLNDPRKPFRTNTHPVW